MASYKILIVLIICFGLPSSGFADLGDNGIVIYSKGTRGNSEFEFKISIRGDKIRMEMQNQADAEPVTYLLDITMQSAFKLLPNRKVLEEAFWPDLTPMLGDHKKKVPALIKTGKAETIAGYPAEQYLRTNDNGSTSEFWLTQAIPLSPSVLRSIAGFTGKFARKDLQDLAEQGYFELKKVQRQPDGSVWMANEVITIERINLKDEVFEIPPDFTQIEKRTGQK